MSIAVLNYSISEPVGTWLKMLGTTLPTKELSMGLSCVKSRDSRSFLEESRSENFKARFRFVHSQNGGGTFTIQKHFNTPWIDRRFPLYRVYENPEVRSQKSEKSVLHLWFKVTVKDLPSNVYLPNRTSPTLSPFPLFLVREREGG